MVVRRSDRIATRRIFPKQFTKPTTPNKRQHFLTSCRLPPTSNTSYGSTKLSTTMSESQPLVGNAADQENFRRLKAYQPYVSHVVIGRKFSVGMLLLLWYRYFGILFSLLRYFVFFCDLSLFGFDPSLTSHYIFRLLIVRHQCCLKIESLFWCFWSPFRAYRTHHLTFDEPISFPPQIYTDGHF